MYAAVSRLHVLLFAEALADHLIRRGFHKARADSFALPVALAKVRNEALIVLDIRVEFLDGFRELSCGVMAIAGHCSVEVHLDGLYELHAL
jgi:hypothetical protein